MNAPADHPALLFTAFEPSGDDHASAVIAEIRRRRPDQRIYAWGGPKMASAGAEVVHRTGEDAVVGIPTLDKILEHQRINRDIERWLRAHPDVAVHVPVDSPAANFPICAIAKKQKRQVVHLVAPQIWAWGGWRINKLRRCTDLVLCFNPFEETWFRERDVPAKFIGNPVFDEPLDLAALSERADALPGGSPKLAIFPGSRPAELRRNFPVMLRTFRQLRERFLRMTGIVGAVNEPVRAQLYEKANLLGGWPEGLDIVAGETDLLVRWCDAAMVVSGTVTLQIAKQCKPMVTMYKTNKIMYELVGRRLITTPLFTLPNLIAGRKVVPELIPYFKDEGQLFEAVSSLLSDEGALESQRNALRADVLGPFESVAAASGAADAILSVMGVEPTDPHVVIRDGVRVGV
ncbi:MAG: hypothetical protein AAGD00_05890 [Planctomycetota bacterium]